MSENQNPGEAQETTPETLVALVRDRDGKISIYSKATDDVQAFIYQVNGFGGNVLAFYAESDVINRVTLTD